MGLFLRTFLMVLIMELGSADQMVLLSTSAHSNHKLMIWIAGITALCIASLISVLAGDYVSKLPFSMNIVSGLILITTGIILLIQK